MARWNLLPGRARGEHGESATHGEDRYGDYADSGVPIDDHELDDGIAQLYADDSVALARWKDRLSQYVDLQGTLDALRLRSATEQPWPASDNPMLGYLIDRGTEIAAQDGLEAAVAWLAANSWFEGAIAERSRFIRLLDAD